MCTIVPLIIRHNCCDESNDNSKGLGGNQQLQSTRRSSTLRQKQLTVVVLDNGKGRGSTRRQAVWWYSTATKTAAVLNKGKGHGGTKQQPLARRYSTVADGEAVLDKKRCGGSRWRRTRPCSMTAMGAVVFNNGHGPMLSDDGRGRTWRMECLTRWMAENILCYLARQKTTGRLTGSCPRHLGHN